MSLWLTVAAKFLCWSDFEHTFQKGADKWGLAKFMSLGRLHEASGSFCIYDTFIIRATVKVATADNQMYNTLIQKVQRPAYACHHLQHMTRS